MDPDIATTDFCNFASQSTCMFVTYFSSANSVNTVQAQRFSYTGSPLDAEFRVTDAVYTNTNSPPSVAYTHQLCEFSNSTAPCFIVAWDNNVYVYFKVYNINGAILKTETMANSFTSSPAIV